MNLATNRKKKMYLLMTLLSIFVVNAAIINVNYSPNNLNGKIIKNIIDIPKNNDLTSDNNYDGIGDVWNITHWANRTDYDLPASFEENSYDMVEMPLGTDWVGYKLNASINNLYDSRNWNNGTFNFGDNNTYATGANDSLYIANSYQNWTFQENIVGSSNVMSGNYLDENAVTPVNTQNHDSLELRMAGNRYNDSGGNPYWYRYWYDTGDKCSWSSTIHVPRGRVIDSWLKFQINPIHIISFNSWEFRIFLNGIQVFTDGLFTLKQRGQNAWHSFNIPQGLWTNTSDVYSTTFLNDSMINIEIALDYTATSAGYGFEDGENTDYQQVIFDNVELITKAEAQPSDIQLKINNTIVEDISWGKGKIELNGNWQSADEKVYTNISSDDVGKLGAFSIDLLTNLNLYAIKHTPESNYETNEGSIGTQFSVNNESSVNWLCYGRVKVPTRYEETEIKINFPNDVVITGVFDPQNPSLNVLSQCDNSTPGVLYLPVKDISATPDGFWKFEATSPNYCEDLTTYNNVTGAWIQSKYFISGEYINITAKITNSPEVSSYIQNTKAFLQIRFPNGTLWADHSQFASVDSSGNVYFNPFQIPSFPPNYEVGEYEAIITWNNSYSLYGLNETGIIYKKFSVSHDSELIPDENFYGDIIEDSSFNLKVSFYDTINNEPIIDAHIYVFNFTHPSVVQSFSEISPGYYFLEFNVGGGVLGNNSLIIYANSSNYVNKQVTIKIGIIRETELTVDNDFLNNVPFEQNFTIQFNYTEKSSSIGVDADSLSTDWLGNYSFVTIAQGRYNLTCSTLGYIAGQLYTLNLYVDDYEHEAKSITIKVFITELKSSLELFINNTAIQPNDIYTVDVWEKLNVSVFYKDILGNPLSGANISITGESFSYQLNENPSFNQYDIILDATDLGHGIDNLIIFAELVNYEPQSIPFIAEIIEKPTNIQILFDGINVTNDPTQELTIGQILNVTVKYMDADNNHVQGALLQLSGDFNGTLSENLLFEQYSYVLNTTQLDIGVRLITLAATRANFQLQTDNLRLNIQRINTNISTINGETIITAELGSNIPLRVVLTDEVFGGTIKYANVTYRWQFGEGELTDPNSDGIYEIELTNVPVGSYVITITATKGDDYEFERYEVTITVTNPPFEFLLFMILLIAAITTVISLVSYLILYKRVLQYPKPIRKVRKYRRTLRKTKQPNISVIPRKEAFDDQFNDEIGKSSKFLKGKPSESIIQTDKFPKKKLIVESDKTPTKGGNT